MYRIVESDLENMDFNVSPPTKWPKKNHFDMGAKHMTLNVYKSELHRNPPNPPNMWKKKYFSHILYVEIK